MSIQKEKKYYVYMLRCADQSLYTGWTTNPEKRESVHNSGQGAKYTRSRLPVKMVFLEACQSKSGALHQEAAIKKLKKNEKEALIVSGFNLLRRGEKNE